MKRLSSYSYMVLGELEEAYGDDLFDKPEDSRDEEDRAEEEEWEKVKAEIAAKKAARLAGGKKSSGVSSSSGAAVSSGDSMSAEEADALAANEKGRLARYISKGTGVLKKSVGVNAMTEAEYKGMLSRYPSGEAEELLKDEGLREAHRWDVLKGLAMPSRVAFTRLDPKTKVWVYGDNELRRIALYRAAALVAQGKYTPYSYKGWSGGSNGEKVSKSRGLIRKKNRDAMLRVIDAVVGDLMANEGEGSAAKYVEYIKSLSGTTGVKGKYTGSNMYSRYQKYLPRFDFLPNEVMSVGELGKRGKVGQGELDAELDKAYGDWISAYGIEPLMYRGEGEGGEERNRMAEVDPMVDEGLFDGLWGEVKKTGGKVRRGPYEVRGSGEGVSRPKTEAGVYDNINDLVADWQSGAITNGLPPEKIAQVFKAYTDGINKGKVQPKQMGKVPVKGSLSKQERDKKSEEKYRAELAELGELGIILTPEEIEKAVRVAKKKGELGIG